MKVTLLLHSLCHGEVLGLAMHAYKPHLELLAQSGKGREATIRIAPSPHEH